MKTPEEIKKAVSLCILSECSKTCPYYKTVSCNTALMLDIFACLEQLEAEREGRSMSETPKCPYCGDRMELHVLPHTTEQEFFSAWYQCVTCESTSPRIEFIGNTSQTKIEERLQAVSSRRAEPKNRVMTLEELKVYTGFLWSENRYSPFDYEGEPAFAEKGFIYAGNGNVDLRRDISNAYGKNWRCWLRKPTEAERRGTPWDGDSRE